MKQARTNRSSRSMKRSNDAAKADTTQFSGFAETLRRPLGEIVSAENAEEFMSLASAKARRAEKRARTFVDSAWERLAGWGKTLGQHRLAAAAGGVGLGLLMVLGLRRRAA